MFLVTVVYSLNAEESYILEMRTIEVLKGVVQRRKEHFGQRGQLVFYRCFREVAILER